MLGVHVALGALIKQWCWAVGCTCGSGGLTESNTLHQDPPFLPKVGRGHATLVYPVYRGRNAGSY